MIDHPYTFPSLLGMLVLSSSMQLGCELSGAEVHEVVPAKPPPSAVAISAVVLPAVAVAPGLLPNAEMKGYALYPGDLIAIDVFDQPDLTLVVRVPPNGGIRFPLLGEIPLVVGREINEFADELKRRLEKDYLQQVTLTVTVREFAKRRAYVMGSVAHPDALDLAPFSRTTALGAIGESGGFLDEANRDSVVVLRDGVQGKDAIAIAVGSPGHAARDVVLQPNDIVMVSRLDRIYVTGQVSHPGSVNLPFAHTTALSAIGEAGGFLDEANRDAVVVLREGKLGGASTTIALGALGHGPKDVILQPNDTVIVPRLDHVYIIGQVNHPGAVSLPSQEALTVSKAVSLAGGFDRYAREGNVQLLRAGLPAQAVDVEAILTGDRSKEDPRLAPGDTVFVPQRRY
jgi:polysaccharide biosynthesis/export protein